MTISLRNSTTPSLFSPSPMQDFVQDTAAVLAPAVAGAIISTISLSGTHNKIKELSISVGEAVKSFFSYFTSEKTTKALSCATGLVALSSGQPILQVAGSSLLTNCLNIPGVLANNTFFTTASFAGNFTPWSVNCTKDGGYIVAGHVVSKVASGDNDIFITKFKKNGTQEWTTILNGTAWNAGYSVLEAQNGEYIVGGYSQDSGLARASLSRFSTNGTALGSITYGESYHLGTHSLRQLSNGDLVLSGFCTNNGNFSVALIKMTSDRNPIWSKTYSVSGNSVGKALLVTHNNTIVVAGQTSIGAGDWDQLLQAFDSDGNKLWANTLGGIKQDLGLAIIETQKRNIAVAGYTDNSGSGKTNGLISLFKPNGDYSFATSFGGANTANAFGIEEMQNEILIVIGVVNGFDAGTGLIAAFNQNGSPLWAQIVKGNSTCNSIQKTPDGGIVISGTLLHPLTQESELFLLKIDANGRLPNCDALEFIDLPVNNITHLLNFSTFSPIQSAINPSATNWTPSIITPQMFQSHICPRNTTTATHSRVQSISKNTQTLSATPSLSRILSPSHSLKTSLSQSITSKHSLSREITKSHTSERTSTKSMSHEQTRTKERTKTAPLQFQRMTLLELSKLSLPGVIRMQLSPSGSLLQTKTDTGYRLITIDAAGKMRTAGEFATLGTTQATAFSLDEKYDFIAGDLGKIQVFDIQNPVNPTSIGFINLGIPIKCLSSSEDGDHLLVGTNTGILTLSAKTPNDIATMTGLTNYTTSNPVVAIHTIPNTNRIVMGTGSDIKILDFIGENFTLIASQNFPSPIKSIAPISQVDPSQIVVSLENQDTVIMNAANSSSFVTLPGTSNEIRAISGKTLLESGLKQGIQILQNENQNWQNTREVGYNPVSVRVTDILYSSDGRFCVYSDSEGVKLMKMVQGSGILDHPLPRLVRNVKPGFPVLEILLNEEKNWIALGGNQLSFIAGDNLEIPTILGTLNTVGNVRKIVAFPDKTKLLFADSGGIGCVNCFNPSAPSILSRWNTNTPINDVTLKGSYAYISQRDRITVLDISNPSSISENAVIPTQASAECSLFNPDGMFSFLGTSDGIDIHSSQFNPLSRLNATGFVSQMRLHNNTLYFANEQYFGKVDVSDPSNPRLLSRLDFTYPIRGLTLANDGKSALLPVEISGTFVVDTQNMLVKGNLPSTTANSIAMNELGDKIYVACNQNGFQVAELITELPVIPLTSKNQYPVEILTEETLNFYNKDLEAIAIDRINSIHLLDKGQKKELPLWISADLVQKKLFIRAPKEFTDQPLDLLISLDVGGVRQETIYQAKVVSSLEISLETGSPSLSTPSTLGSISVQLNGATFMPHPPGLLSVSSKDNILQAQGPISVINNYLQQIRINPDPIQLSRSDVALNLATIIGTDIVNLFPTNGTVRLRNFAFNKAPVVNQPMDQINKKALSSFEIIVPPSTFIDSDDQKLILTAELANGTKLPSWLKFDPITATFSGIAPTSMLNQTLQIRLNASDGYLSVNNKWELHIDSNRGPFVARPLPSQTRETGSEFSFEVPKKTFQSLDNNTLTFSAMENGYNTLPTFLSFDPTTLTFRGTPSVDDIRAYSIKLTATDQFGASATLDFDLNIQFSNGDFIDYILNQAAIASAVITPFSAAYLYRKFLYNLIHRKSYWRNKSPLIDNQAYRLKKPNTQKEIDLDEIAKVHVQEIDKKKLAHEFAKNHFPLHSYISLYSHALINNVPLPSWLKFDSETGEITLQKLTMPHDKTYVFQVVGRNGHILESFIIESERNSVNLSEVISRSDDFHTPLLDDTKLLYLHLDPNDLDQEMQDSSVTIANTKPAEEKIQQPIQDVWADLGTLASSRPGEESPPNMQHSDLTIPQNTQFESDEEELSHDDEFETSHLNESYQALTGANSTNPNRNVLENALENRHY